MSDKEKCFVCSRIISPIPSESLRETLCPECGASRRNRDLAKAVLDTFVSNSLSLSENLDKFNNLRIYEAQCSGALHKVLKNIPHYVSSEYIDSVPRGVFDKEGRRSEDLQNLTFKDNSFDLVITQDVLEHVPRPMKAFSEIKRILKPEGVHIFTIPIHEGQKTVTRATVDKNGDTVNLLPPVFHGDPLKTEGSLVYTDFGSDLVDDLTSNGYLTEIVLHSKFYEDTPNLETKDSYNFYLKCYKENNLLKCLKYNSIVFRSKKKKGK